MDIIHSHSKYRSSNPAYATISPSEMVLRLHWDMHRRARGEEGLPLFVPQNVDPDDVVEAQIRQGRWVALCLWCANAQYASPHDDRFYCVNCRNHGKLTWARVIFPENWREIEEVLSEREDPYTADWLPGEMADQLREENESHRAEIEAERAG